MRLGLFTALWVMARSPRGIFLALCWMLLIGLCAPVQAKRIALVIGNDQYASVDKLKNARNDARLIASVLTKAGFGVTQANDLGREGLWSTIDAFKSNIGKGDEVVFYFAGHGVQIGSTQLLLPTDINPKSEAQVQRDGVPLIEVQDAFKDARVAIFIIDACRDNPFPKQGTRTLGASRGMLPPEPSAGQIIMLSAGRNQKALDQVPGQNVSNSLFTWELAQAIQNPGMEIRSALERVKDLVDDKARAAQHEQRPSLVNDLRGNFYFFGPTTVIVGPQAPAKPEAVAPSVRPGQVQGLSLADLEREEATRKEWTDWQGRMKADFDKTAAFAGSADLMAKAWERFLVAWAQDNPMSTQDEALRGQALVNAAKADAQKLAADAASERANKAGLERRAAEEVQKAAQRAASERAAAEAAAKEQQRLAIEAQAKEQARLALLTQEQVRLAAEAAQKLAAARLAELPKPGQVLKDCADCPEMVFIPAGSFEMGSNESAEEQPIHRVNVPGFLLGKTEVTQGQWKAVMGSNPSSFSICGDDCPVERVSWDDAKDFAQRLSQKTGNQYRLPSEAEWEYATRAGSSTKWSFGDVEYQIGDYAWFSANTQYKTQRVAQKRPNAFGLFDMHGNVWEWVEDCWHGSYSGAPTDGSAWTTGCNGKGRVLRGGSWVNDSAGLRSAVRHRDAPDYGGVFGLRLARTPDAASELANKAEQERRAAQEVQKAAEHQRLVMVAQANQQVYLGELVDRERTAREAAVQEQARVATEAAQRLAAARLAVLPKPGQVIKDCADCPEMVVIPAGSFTMGSSAAEQVLAIAAGLQTELVSPENPQHRVNIRSFAAGRYAISKGEFATFVRAKGYQTEAERGDGCFAWNGKEFKKDAAYNWRNVGFAQADNHPVVCVSWNDAQAYIAWLNQTSGQNYRLLSEAEREYAARGGTQTAFWWGDSINTEQANYAGTSLSYNGSPKGQYRQATVPVNSFSPNPFGLYNVHGNVWEWTQDCWNDNYNGAPTDGSAWTTFFCRYRVLRGGSWGYYPVILRSASRFRYTPVTRYITIGLRLAMTLPTS